MKTKLLFASLIFMAFTFAQDNHKTLNLTSSLTLKLSSTSGTNGCAVAYNPKKQLYYTAIAGNSGFPLEIFNSNGQHLYTTTTMCDSRGMWMSKGKLYAVTAGENASIYEYTLNKTGYPTSSTLVTEINKPDFNSCSSINKKYLYFRKGELVYNYSLKTNSLSTDIKLEYPNGIFNNINTYCVIHTGKKGYEIGILDYVKKKVLLFNIKTGILSATCNLPYTAICDANFGFSYCNDYIWLYDKNNKEWKGYKLDL